MKCQMSTRLSIGALTDVSCCADDPVLTCGLKAACVLHLKLKGAKGTTLLRLQLLYNKDRERAASIDYRLFIPETGRVASSRARGMAVPEIESALQHVRLVSFLSCSHCITCLMKSRRRRGASSASLSLILH